MIHYTTNKEGERVPYYLVGEGDNAATKVRYDKGERCTKSFKNSEANKNNKCPSTIEIYNNNHCGIESAHKCSLAPQ